MEEQLLLQQWLTQGSSHLQTLHTVITDEDLQCLLGEISPVWYLVATTNLPLLLYVQPAIYVRDCHITPRTAELIRLEFMYVQ